MRVCARAWINMPYIMDGKLYKYKKGMNEREWEREKKNQLPRGRGGGGRAIARVLSLYPGNLNGRENEEKREKNKIT